MKDTLGKSLKKLKWIRMQRKRLSAILLVLSLIVTLHVFWALRQPGLTLAGDAACGIPEHTHKDECFTQVNICGLSEEAHIHEEACYTTQFIEAQETIRLVCSQTETPHVHGDSCYTTQLIESQETRQLICTETTEPHIHADGCYEVQYTEAQEIRQLICTQTDELHSHDDSCYEIQIIEAQETRQLVCDQTEQPHEHSDSCYEIIAAAPVEKTVLNCELQVEPHEHTEDCYVSEITEAHEEQVLTCGLSETAHIHEDACYSLECNCEQQEHTHSIECYCDETADVETLLDWQNMFADYHCEGATFAGLPVKLYNIADVSADFQYRLTPPFQSSGLVLNGVRSASEWNVIRSTLEAHILTNGVTETDSAVTDQTGQVRFDKLKPGLYLAVPDHATEVHLNCLFDPALVSLPGLGTDGLWQYQVSVISKGAILPPADTDEVLTFKVLKLWKGDSNHSKRPKAIEVELFRNNESYKTVILSEDNHWSYSWTTKDDGAKWMVAERNVPSGYTATLEKRDTSFVLTNTLVPNTPPSGAEWPKTGDTSHIMLYMLLMYTSGILLVILGITGKKKRV